MSRYRTFHISSLFTQSCKCPETIINLMHLSDKVGCYATTRDMSGKYQNFSPSNLREPSRLMMKRNLMTAHEKDACWWRENYKNKNRRKTHEKRKKCRKQKKSFFFIIRRRRKKRAFIVWRRKLLIWSIFRMCVESFFFSARESQFLGCAVNRGAHGDNRMARKVVAQFRKLTTKILDWVIRARSSFAPAALSQKAEREAPVLI